MTTFKEFKLLKKYQHIILLELKESFKQNVVVTDNDTDGKRLFIDNEPIGYEEIKQIKL